MRTGCVVSPFRLSCTGTEKGDAWPRGNCEWPAIRRRAHVAAWRSVRASEPRSGASPRRKPWSGLTRVSSTEELARKVNRVTAQLGVVPSLGGHGRATRRCCVGRGARPLGGRPPESVAAMMGGPAAPAVSAPPVVSVVHADGGMANETVLVDLGPGRPGLVVRLPPLQADLPGVRPRRPRRRCRTPSPRRACRPRRRPSWSGIPNGSGAPSWPCRA